MIERARNTAMIVMRAGAYRRPSSPINHPDESDLHPSTDWSADAGYRGSAPNSTFVTTCPRASKSGAQVPVMNPRASSGTVLMISAVRPWHRHVDDELPMMAVATKFCPGLSSQVSRISLEGLRLGSIFSQALPDAPPAQTYTSPFMQRQFVAWTAATSLGTPCLCVAP